MSLLYYYGTAHLCRHTDGPSAWRLPNLTVRESFVRDGYHGTSIFRLDVGRLAALLGQMAYRGEW